MYCEARARDRGGNVAHRRVRLQQTVRQDCRCRRRPFRPCHSIPRHVHAPATGLFHSRHQIRPNPHYPGPVFSLIPVTAAAIVELPVPWTPSPDSLLPKSPPLIPSPSTPACVALIPNTPLPSPPPSPNKPSPIVGALDTRHILIRGVALDWWSHAIDPPKPAPLNVRRAIGDTGTTDVRL